MGKPQGLPVCPPCEPAANVHMAVSGTIPHLQCILLCSVLPAQLDLSVFVKWVLCFQLYHCCDHLWFGF